MSKRGHAFAHGVFYCFLLSSAYARIEFCFTLHFRSLYSAYTELSFTSFRVTSALCSLMLSSAYARIEFCFTLHFRSLYSAYTELSFTSFRVTSALCSLMLSSAYAKFDNKKRLNCFNLIYKYISQSTTI